MEYAVSKRIFGPFWRRWKNVVGDGVIESARMRWLALKTGEVIEVPMDSEFRFSAERAEVVRQAAEEKARQEELARMSGN